MHTKICHPDFIGTSFRPSATCKNFMLGNNTIKGSALCHISWEESPSHKQLISHRQFDVRLTDRYREILHFATLRSELVPKAFGVDTG